MRAKILPYQALRSQVLRFALPRIRFPIRFAETSRQRAQNVHVGIAPVYQLVARNLERFAVALQKGDRAAHVNVPHRSSPCLLLGSQRLAEALHRRVVDLLERIQLPRMEIEDAVLEGLQRMDVKPESSRKGAYDYGMFNKGEF